MSAAVQDHHAGAVSNGHAGGAASAAQPRLRRLARRGRPRASAAAPGPLDPEVRYLEYGPEVVAALLNGKVGFQEIALAYLFGRPADDAGDSPGDRSVSEANRAELQRHFPVLMRQYLAEHECLARSYFARNCFAAAALTGKDEIEVVLARDVAEPEAVELIRRAHGLGFTVWHRIDGSDRRLCQRMIFSVIVEVLRRLDRAAQASGVAPALSRQELAHLHRNLDEAEDIMLRCASRKAQSQYVRGMLSRGSVIVAPLVVAAAVVGVLEGSFTTVLGQALLVCLAGTIGALVSVMWRMTSGTFSINLPTLGEDAAGKELRLVGAMRPGIGGIFALAVFVFVKSPLVPLAPASKADAYLLVALGFLAGFSERFAQDVFVRSGQGLTGPGGDAPSTGLSAGLAPPPGAVGGGRRPRAR